MIKLLQSFKDRRNDNQRFLALDEKNNIHTMGIKPYRELCACKLISKDKNLLINKYDDILAKILETGLYRLQSKQAVMEFALLDIIIYLDAVEIEEDKIMSFTEFIRLYEFSLNRMLAKAYRRLCKPVEFSSELLVKYDITRELDRNAKHLELTISKLIELRHNSNMFEYPVISLGTKIFRNTQSKVAIIESAQLGDSLLLNILEKDIVRPTRIFNSNIGFQFKPENLIIQNYGLKKDLLESKDKYLVLRVM